MHARNLLPWLLVLLALGACGPISATTHLMDAREPFEAARREGAETFAPYEFTKAEIYLRKSKELQGYSDYEQAVRFADKARTMAEEAIRVARRNKMRHERLQKARAAVPPTPPPVQKRVIEVQGAPAPTPAPAAGGAR